MKYNSQLSINHSLKKTEGGSYGSAEKNEGEWR